ncbi:uncharacterized protein LOC129224307 [Uloborus diversus]|uniref:uncharacterized protein LOC129224307 n=1 Tax=Uloborus diversus TaxID=327109 RepID=UPI002409D4DF|nr:uncharacterized protein LOC129224307 [Uloborus diversus]
MRSSSQNDVPEGPAQARRKKCQSESGLPVDLVNQEKSLLEGIIRERGKSLDDAISRYVDKMIRNSIVEAIKNVNVESLYEEIIKDFSDHKSFSGSDEMLVDSKDIMSSEDWKTRDNLSTGNRECNDYSSDDEFSEDVSHDGNAKDILIKEHKRENSGEIKEDSETKEGSNFPNDCQVRCEVTANEEYLPDLKESVLDGYQADCDECDSINSILSISSDGKLDERINELIIPNANIDNEMETDSDTGKDNETQILGNLKTEDSVNTEVNDTSSENTGKGRLSRNGKEEPKDLITMSPGSDDASLKPFDFPHPDDQGKNVPSAKQVQEEEKKMNWKVGYLHVKSPHKSRGKTHLKVWKKRCVSIQPDEFVNDPKNPCLMISVYNAESGTSRKHNAVFWKTVSCQKAVVYRSSSRSHKYAFTISDDNKAVIHLAADSETLSQEWMAAIRAILWPPSPVIQLEKMLNGSEFEISLVDNDFSFHAGLLGMYGYLSITPKKLILLHPQQGYVIQEWYLNTVDKFQLMAQAKVEDVNKVLSMTTCSDSSTGKGEILIFCNEAVSLLQALAQTIHQVLSYHSKQDGGKYKKELDEIADWLIGPTSIDREGPAEEYYKVPPRQVKSLLDIPNFIFAKSLSPVASMIDTASAGAEITKQNLQTSKGNTLMASHDSGISAGNAMDDFLNCSVASFKLGGGNLTGKSSDSELSDTYSPPHTPAVQRKHLNESKNKEPVET